MAAATLIFQDDLRDLVRQDHETGAGLLYHFDRKASIKDVIEALGAPHPLVEELTVNGRAVGFDYILRHGDNVEVRPLTPPVNPLVPTLLRPEPLDRIAFVVDVNVGKLALLLRMLGFDTIYDNDKRDAQLAEISRSGKRILLTRDISLLKRKIVMHGYLLRENDPDRQLIEVIRLYGLRGRIKPLTRCMPCNGRLVPVSKEEVLARLEPLTKKYYDSFHICEICRKIYWAGSHQEKIMAYIEAILAEAGRPSTHIAR